MLKKKSQTKKINMIQEVNDNFYVLWAEDDNKATLLEKTDSYFYIGQKNEVLEFKIEEVKELIKAINKLTK